MIRSQRFDHQRPALHLLACPRAGLLPHPGLNERHSDLAPLKRTLVPYMNEGTDVLGCALCETGVVNCAKGTRGKYMMGTKGRIRHARPDGAEPLSRETRGDGEVLEKPNPVCASYTVSFQYVAGVEEVESVNESVTDGGNEKGREVTAPDAERG